MATKENYLANFLHDQLIKEIISYMRGHEILYFVYNLFKENKQNYRNLIKSLKLKGDNFSNTDLKLASELTDLQYLNLSKARLITDFGTQYLSVLTNLTYLNLNGCYRISDSTMITISKLYMLRKLNLNNCSNINISYILCLKYLERLSLNNCPNVDDKIFDILSFEIKHLDLRNTSITGYGLDNDRFLNLIKFDVSHNVNLVGYNLIYFLEDENRDNLMSLNLN